MISKEVDYAVRALLFLAENYEQSERFSAATVAEKMHIPYRFLRNIIRVLAEKGFIESRRGNGGGLRLAKSPEQFSLYDVVKAMNPSSCMLNSCLICTGKCLRDNICPVHEKLVEVQKLIDEKLKEIKFNTLV